MSLHLYCLPVFSRNNQAWQPFQDQKALTANKPALGEPVSPIANVATGISFGIYHAIIQRRQRSISVLAYSCVLSGVL